MNSQDQTVVGLLGVHDLVVVRTDTATLVAGREHAERIKELVAEVNGLAGEQYT